MNIEVYLKPIRAKDRPMKLGKNIKISKELMACIKDGIFDDLFIVEPKPKK